MCLGEVLIEGIRAKLSGWSGGTRWHLEPGVGCGEGGGWVQHMYKRERQVR